MLDIWAAPGGAPPARLHLANNAGVADLLPKELLDSRDGSAIIAAYRRFRGERARSTLRPLNEVKLLVVGNEAVGKTSLLRYMLHGQARDPGERKTPGIVQHEKITIQGGRPPSVRPR